MLAMHPTVSSLKFCTIYGHLSLAKDHSLAPSLHTAGYGPVNHKIQKNPYILPLLHSPFSCVDNRRIFYMVSMNNIMSLHINSTILVVGLIEMKFAFLSSIN